MTQPPANPRDRDASRLRDCLREGRSFWLYGLKGCGKTHRLNRALAGLPSTARQRAVKVVTLFPEMDREHWSGALFAAFGQAPRERDLKASDEGLWTRWCEVYAEQAHGTFIVIDGWQWMPPELLRHGAQILFHQDLSCGFVACATPHTYLWADQILKLHVIECPMLTAREEQEMIRALFEEMACAGLYEIYARFAEDRTGHPMHQLALAQTLVKAAPLRDDGTFDGTGLPDDLSSQVPLSLARNLLEVFDEDTRQALAPLCHLRGAVTPHVLWRYFDRAPLLHAIEYGALYEDFDTVVVPDALARALRHVLKPSRAQWEALLRCLWDGYRTLSNPGANPAALQQLLDVFAQTVRCGSCTKEDRAFLVEVMDGIDEDFEQLVAIPRFPAALAALEAIPANELRALPAARFRLAQCLMLAGRRGEANELLRGLLRMKNTKAGKKAFIWIQMFAALEGNPEEAIAALTHFLDERVDLGDPLDLVARLVLSRILYNRGYFRRALPITLAGIQGARAQGSAQNVHLLRNLHGMCLSFTGEQEAGLAMMQDACNTLEALGMQRAYVEARHTLATVCFELGQHEEARSHVRAARVEYERLLDERNLRMLDVMEHLIAFALDEDAPQSATRFEHDSTSAVWTYYQAELKFVEGLRAQRRGDSEAAIRHLHGAFMAHLAGGTVQAFGRILEHYLPLLLERVSFAQARELLSSLQRQHLEERHLDQIVERLLDAIWLTGDFSKLSLTTAELSTGAHDWLFPRSPGHTHSPMMSDWAEEWEGVVCGQTRDFEPYAELPGSAQLAPLHRAWAALWAGDDVACCRWLYLCEGLDLNGSLFGFLRSLLQQAADGSNTPASTGQTRWRSEILAFWRGLTPAMVVHQLTFWEAQLSRPELPEALRTMLKPWLTTIHHWRVQKAMLIDECLGVVYLADRRYELGSDTISFAVLTHLARRQPHEPPVSTGELFESVWQRPYRPASSNNNVYATIRNLRLELDDDTRSESVIRLERGEGYVLGIPAVFSPT